MNSNKRSNLSVKSELLEIAADFLPIDKSPECLYIGFLIAFILSEVSVFP